MGIMKLMNTKELPEVTTADNGKTLVVENGEWTLGNGGGGTGGGVTLVRKRFIEDELPGYNQIEVSYNTLKQIYENGGVAFVVDNILSKYYIDPILSFEKAPLGELYECNFGIGDYATTYKAHSPTEYFKDQSDEPLV